MGDDIKNDNPLGFSPNTSSSEELEMSIIQWQSPYYKIWLKITAMIMVGVFLCQQVVWAGDIKDILPDNKQAVPPAMQTLNETEEALRRQQELMDEQEIIQPAIEPPFDSTQEQEISPPVTEQPADQPLATDESPVVGESPVGGESPVREGSPVGKNMVTVALGCDRNEAVLYYPL